MTVGPNKKGRGSSLPGVLLLLLSLAACVWTVQVFRESRALDAPSGVGTAEGSPVGAVATPDDAVALNAARFAELTLSAQAAILVNASTGQTLFELNAEDARPAASTIKIVTALTVLRHAGPEEIVTIQREDVVDPIQESNMSLLSGDVITVHDLLVGLLVPSGNDAANALARVVGGRLAGEGSPMERFVAEMNVTAELLGMTASRFVNPSGDDAEGQVSTARDLVTAARMLLAEPSLAPIVALRKAEVRVGGPRSRVIQLTNTNEMLLEDGIYGVKTGTTPKAAQCLILAHRGDQSNEIVVILGSRERYVDARKLLGLPEPAIPASATPTTGRD